MLKIITYQFIGKEMVRPWDSNCPSISDSFSSLVNNLTSDVFAFKFILRESSALVSTRRTLVRIFKAREAVWTEFDPSNLDELANYIDFAMLSGTLMNRLSHRMGLTEWTVISFFLQMTSGMVGKYMVPNTGEFINKIIVEQTFQ